MDRDRLIEVGTVTRPWGVRGEVRVFPATDIPGRFEALEAVWVLVAGRSPHRLGIESVKKLKHMFAVKLEGVEDPEEAERYRDAVLAVSEEERPELEEGSYFIDELVGLAVVGPGGEQLGTLSRVYQGAAQDVLEVQDEAGNTSLVPAVEAWVHEIDIEGGRVVLTIPEIEERPPQEQDGGAS